MTDLELWEDVHDIMGAGHETTATSTATAIYLISAHPEVEAKLVKEINQVLGMSKVLEKPVVVNSPNCKEVQSAPRHTHSFVLLYGTAALQGLSVFWAHTHLKGITELHLSLCQS